MPTKRSKSQQDSNQTQVIITQMWKCQTCWGKGCQNDSEYDQGNTTITHCRPTQDIVRKSHRALTAISHQENN